MTQKPSTAGCVHCPTEQLSVVQFRPSPVHPPPSFRGKQPSQHSFTPAQVQPAPKQTPPWQVSPPVAGSPSSQTVLSATFGFEHVPLAVSHRPAAWHRSWAAQTTGCVPAQAPAEQRSTAVQASPSSQLTPSGKFRNASALNTESQYWHVSPGFVVPSERQIPSIRQNVARTGWMHVPAAQTSSVQAAASSAQAVPAGRAWQPSQQSVAPTHSQPGASPDPLAWRRGGGSSRPSDGSLRRSCHGPLRRCRLERLRCRSRPDPRLRRPAVCPHPPRLCCCNPRGARLPKESPVQSSAESP